MRISRLLLAAAVLLSAGCQETLGLIEWTDVPADATMYSATREEFAGRNSAFDLAGFPPRALPIESEAAAQRFDFLLMDRNGGLALAPAGLVDGFDSRASIATMTGVAFDDVERAPGDANKFTTDPVQLQLGVVYILKSRPAVCTLTTGVIYAKVQPIAIDVANGRFEFEYVYNPNCGERSLIPED